MIVLSENIIKSLIEAGLFLDQKGLCPATSGNLSARLNDKTALITASGTHLGKLKDDDFLEVDWGGHYVSGDKRPSAETLLHTSLYEHDPEIGAVLHTHSLRGTLLSQLITGEALLTQGYEIHKVFPQINTHLSTLKIPIFENRQEIPALVDEIHSSLKSSTPIYGYLLRGHGLYTWGKTIHEAKIRVEAFEFLFACEVKMREIRQ